jgi:hypothetical protein
MNNHELSIYSTYKNLGLLPTKKNVKEHTGYSYSSLLRLNIHLLTITRKLKDENNTCLCKQCGLPFIKETKVAIFCSRECYGAFKIGKTNITKVTKVNKGCTAKSRLTPKVEKENKFETVPEKECLNCSSMVKIQKKFCSTRCCCTYKSNSLFKEWVEFRDIKDIPNSRLRKYLTTLFGYKCSKCGIDSWQGNKITFEVEHIDGNSSNCHPSNVCLLCPNCHSQTPTYKAKNKGNGRLSRRLRYAEGKSY